MILLKTNFGDIKINLFNEEAPKTAANFQKYVEEGFYDGIIFHRVIDGFMVQGGGMLPGMEEKRTISLRSRSNSCARVAFLNRAMDPRHPPVSSLPYLVSSCN